MLGGTVWSEQPKALVPLDDQGDGVDSDVRWLSSGPRVLLPELVHHHGGVVGEPLP